MFLFGTRRRESGFGSVFLSDFLQPLKSIQDGSFVLSREKSFQKREGGGDARSEEEEEESSVAPLVLLRLQACSKQQSLQHPLILTEMSRIWIKTPENLEDPSKIGSLF